MFYSNYIFVAAGSDFQNEVITLTFGPNNLQQIANIEIEDDDVVESDESFNIVLSPGSSGLATLGSPNSAVVTITDNDGNNY